jgi:hypothetical protein
MFGLDAGSTFTAKASIAGTLATFGVFTTGLLQWFTAQYGQQLTYGPETDTVEVVTLNLLAQPRKQRFHIAEVQQVDSVHPLSSFKVSRNFVQTSRAWHLPARAAAACTTHYACAPEALQLGNGVHLKPRTRVILPAFHRAGQWQGVLPRCG